MDGNCKRNPPLFFRLFQLSRISIIFLCRSMTMQGRKLWGGIRSPEGSPEISIGTVRKYLKYRVPTLPYLVESASFGRLSLTHYPGSMFLHIIILNRETSRRKSFRLSIFDPLQSMLRLDLVCYEAFVIILPSSLCCIVSCR